MIKHRQSTGKHRDEKWSSVGTFTPARNWEGVVTSERQLCVSNWELWPRGLVGLRKTLQGGE